MPSEPSLARSIGRFFGEIGRAVSTPTDMKPGERREVSRHVEEEEHETPQGRVTLRRTIIEEIELPEAAARATEPAEDADAASGPSSPPPPNA